MKTLSKMGLVSLYMFDLLILIKHTQPAGRDKPTTHLAKYNNIYSLN